MGENNEKTKPSLGRKMRLKLKIPERGGHWGILETAKLPKKKIIQNRKTAKKLLVDCESRTFLLRTS